MARSQSLIIFFTVFLVFAGGELRTRRSSQFSEASASAGSSGGYGRGFGLQFGPQYGPPGPPVPHFGPPGPPVPNFGPPRPRFEPYQPPFGHHGHHGHSGFNRQDSGRTINIAKSISISTGGSGSARSEARSQSGRYGK